MELWRHPLFSACTRAEAEELFRKLRPRKKRFEKGSVLLFSGELVRETGVVLDGSVQVERVDYDGNRSIVNVVRAGDVFAEAYACEAKDPLPVSVVARESAEILFLNLSELLSLREDAARKVVNNLLILTAQKNLQLSRRMFLISEKTVRQKVLSYLSEQRTKADSDTFAIPFDRQQLADYLNVERTALSKELGKLRREGRLRFRKNVFTLL